MDKRIIHGKPLGPRVTDVQIEDNYMLLITFSNNEKRLFDVKPLFSYDAFKPLENISLFRKVRTDHGTVTWPGDIDYCPDTLYAESIPVSCR